MASSLRGPECLKDVELHLEKNALEKMSLSQFGIWYRAVYKFKIIFLLYFKEILLLHVFLTIITESNVWNFVSSNNYLKHK